MLAELAATLTLTLIRSDQGRGLLRGASISVAAKETLLLRVPAVSLASERREVESITSYS